MESEKVPLKTFPRTWSLTCIIAKNLKEGLLFSAYSLNNEITDKLISYIRGAFNKFPDFFAQAFKIVIDSSKFSILLLYIL